MNNIMKQQSINDRIYARNIPSTLLEPSLPFRPVNTKYVYLDDISPLYTTNLDATNNKYNDNEIFNPGDRAGPWIGFSSNIDIESTLRDQLHRTKCKSNYTPNYKSSDLYNVNIKNNNQNIVEFPYLFSKKIINPCHNNNKTQQPSTSSSSSLSTISTEKNTNTFNTCTRLLR